MEAYYFTVLWWFLPNIDMNQPWVHMCPPSQTTFPPSSPSHTSGLSQCTSFESPVSCIKLGLVIYFTYGNIYVSMLFSQIMPSLPSPTESKSLSLYLCLFCCLVYRVVVTIFLNSVYMHWYTVLAFFFLTYFTLYNTLQLHPPHYKSWRGCGEKGTLLHCWWECKLVQPPWRTVRNFLKNLKQICCMTQQSHCWANTLRKSELKDMYPSVHHSTVYNS